MKHTSRIALACAFAVAGGSFLAGCAAPKSTATPTTTSKSTTTHSRASTTTAKPKATTATVPPTTAKPAPKVLLDKSGNGIQTFPPVAIKGPWTLKYSFDCSSFGESGNFQVYINNADGSSNFSDNGPNALAKSGASSDYEPQGGNLSLEVNSECNWTVQMIGQPG